MININLQTIIASIIISALIVGAKEPSLTTVTFRVLDEAGLPISDAWVHGTGYWRPAKSSGNTDNEGYFSYEDRVFGDIGCRAGKTGYYDTCGEMWPGPRYFGDHPTNALIVVLKKKINPVPLTTKRITTHLPRLITPVAFDLNIGDWVDPDGKGREKDVWITAEKRMANINDYELKVHLSFTNILNGIQAFSAPSPYEIALASELMPPQEAPQDGYQGSLDILKSKTPGHMYTENWQKNRNYVFRIRTVTNEIGKIIAANHGWIMGDFVIGPDVGKTTIIIFNYYYNPDPHSRSLESNAAL